MIFLTNSHTSNHILIASLGFTVQCNSYDSFLSGIQIWMYRHYSNFKLETNWAAFGLIETFIFNQHTKHDGVRYVTNLNTTPNYYFVDIKE